MIQLVWVYSLTIFHSSLYLHDADSRWREVRRSCLLVAVYALNKHGLRVYYSILRIVAS